MTKQRDIVCKFSQQSLPRVPIYAHRRGMGRWRARLVWWWWRA